MSQKLKKTVLFKKQKQKNGSDTEQNEAEQLKGSSNQMKAKLDQKKNDLETKEIQSQIESLIKNYQCQLKTDSPLQKIPNQSKEQIQQQKGSKIQQSNINILDSQANHRSFERDLIELESILDLKLIKEYAERGNEAVQKIENKDILILIGATGAGKTTSLYYFLGHPMLEEDFEIDDQDGNKEKQFKRVIGSKVKLENAKIGNTDVSETQFLNIFDMEYQQKKFLLTKSPGFKDKRKLEIDLTNNINTIKMLKACKSIRFILLINYFDIIAERGASFREAALIAAKMLNGSDFERNLESVCVFYTKVKEADLKSIRTSIVSIKNGINSLDMMGSYDKKLLIIFLNYLIDQIDEEKSMILNPLDGDQRIDVLQKIFSKASIQNPDQKLNSFSFSKESESQLKLYCNLVQSKIEYYSNQFKFQEISKLLSLLQELYDQIQYQQIDLLFKTCQMEIVYQFQNKLKNEVYHIIENLKNNNKFHQFEINIYKQTNYQLKVWEENSYPHFSNSNIESYEIKDLIKMYESLDQINEVLGTEYQQKDKNYWNNYQHKNKQIYIILCIESIGIQVLVIYAHSKLVFRMDFYIPMYDTELKVSQYPKHTLNI
ncbi:hypothetical protein ABPG74_022612 [Tetrahymena malaccensis]